MNLSDFRDIHKGRPMIVCGLGESIKQMAAVCVQDFLTIGVNDIGRHFTPNYLVCINPPESFEWHRWMYIFDSQAKYLFSQLALNIRKSGKVATYAEVVQFKLGKKHGVDISSDDSLPHTSNSPYVALALAAFMGASKIGLIGVDFVDHPNLTNARRLDKEYAALRDGLGVEVFNLSAVSKLEAFPKISIEDFAR